MSRFVEPLEREAAASVEAKLPPFDAFPQLRRNQNFAESRLICDACSDDHGLPEVPVRAADRRPAMDPSFLCNKTPLGTCGTSTAMMSLQKTPSVPVMLAYTVHTEGDGNRGRGAGGSASRDRDRAGVRSGI
jgi:hypothetical protein